MTLPHQLSLDAEATEMAEINARLDVALDQRVQLHCDRADRKITVREYLDGLKAVRDAEDELEPRRRELGAEHSRAFELVLLEQGAAA